MCGPLSQCPTYWDAGQARCFLKGISSSLPLSHPFLQLERLPHLQEFSVDAFFANKLEWGNSGALSHAAWGQAGYLDRCPSWGIAPWGERRHGGVRGGLGHGSEVWTPRLGKASPLFQQL